MKELTQFNWKAFNPTSGAKFAIGVVLLMVAQNLTGESWMTTALIALFAWLANIPGPLKDRIGGMVGFTLGAIFCTLLVSLVGTELVPGIIALSVVGLLGTVAALWGARAGMVGWAVVIYMIYAPSFVAGIGLEHALLAILIGVSILFLLNVVDNVINPDNDAPESAGDAGADSGYIAAYALIIAIAFAVGSWLGQSMKTDPTMIAATAFFVIGFDTRKTFIGGIARLIGIALGILLGTALLMQIEPGLVLSGILVLVCFLCFATSGIHPGFLMFFLTLFTAAGWQSMQPDLLELTIKEKMMGEFVGVVIAFVSLALLQFYDKQKEGNK